MGIIIIPLALFLLSTFSAAKDKAEIIEKPDPPLQRITYTPRKPPHVSENEGLLRGKYDLWFYPYIVQSMDRSSRSLRVVITIRGPQTYGYDLGAVTFAIDGKVLGPSVLNTVIPDKSGCMPSALGGACQTSWDDGGEGTDSFLRILSSAREVYMTISGGSGRHSFLLSNEQLQDVRDMLQKYDSLQ